MFTSTIMIVVVIASGLSLLAIVQLILAAKHDRAVAAAGPIEEIAVYDRRIDQKRSELEETERDLETRRQALAEIASNQAEVDALITQKENLLTEWASLEERRREVMAVREDMEAALTERQGLEAELVEKREEYLAVKERLEKAEQLVYRIEGLSREYADLTAKVDGMRDQLRDLEEAQARVDSLSSRALELTTDIAVKDGQIEAKTSALEDAAASLSAQKEAIAGAQTELSQVQAQVSAGETEVNRHDGELAALGEQKMQSEARLAYLSAEIAKADARLEPAVAQLSQHADAINAAQTDLSQLQTELAAHEIEKSRYTGEIEALSEQKMQVVARLANLSAEIEKAEGSIGGASVSSSIDPLKELNESPPVIVELEKLPLQEQISEADALRNVELRFRAFGLEYPTRTLRAFHTAMKVNESTQMAVLAGISGTGKSQLPRQYAAAMGIGFLQVPVQPRWDSPQDLMGFFNYIESKFRPTDMARALWALDALNNPENAIEDRMMMVLLDEMNLARVEYYFSDFLSRLESRPAADKIGDKGLRKDAEIELEIPKLAQPPRIFPGYNLLFAGTMNEDESTQSLSDKVVDRANILRFAAPKTVSHGKIEGDVPDVHALSQKNWQRWVKPVSHVDSESELINGVDQMVELMKGFKRPFGHRLGRAMMAYTANYPALEGVDQIRDALSDQVEMRLLPKLRGVEVDDMDAQFSKLLSFVETDLKDEVLAEAIKGSKEASESTGQFVWAGVTR